MDKESQCKQKFKVRIRIAADGQADLDRADPPPFLLDHFLVGKFCVKFLL